MLLVLSEQGETERADAHFHGVYEEPIWIGGYGPRKPAPHIGHRMHLCDMVEKGEISLDQMKALVKDPKFICRKCGRVAARAENLCEPVPL